MIVLALDTASPRASVAVLAGERLVEEPLSVDRRASEELLGAVDRALARADARLKDCSRVAVCSGPGSFTGVRVGLATAWGLGRTLGIPIESVPTLEAMAESARETGAPSCLAALEAGHGEAIARRYSLADSRARPIGEIVRVPTSELSRLAGEDPLVALPPELCPRALAMSVSPAAALATAVARRPSAGVDEPLRAVYARPSAAEEKRGPA